MSVRKETRQNPATGKEYTRYTVDVTYRFPDGRVVRVRRDPTIQTVRSAEKLEREILKALEDGTYGKAKSVQVPTFETFAKEFLSTYAEANNKDSEVASKRTILDKHLVPTFGNLRLDQIGGREIEGFKRSKVKEQKKPKTINNYLTVLRKALDVAREWKLIATVPAIKWMKAGEAPFKFLTFGDAEKLIAAADREWRTMIMTGTRTGLRMGELLALAWKDVDLDAGRITVWRNVSRGKITSPKNYKKREVPLGDDVRAELGKHRHSRGEFVFCKDDGSMLTKGQCKHPLWRACKRAGIARLGWHALRHTFASHLVMRGAPLKVVQELLGHSTIEMTMRYAHLAPELKDAVVKLLDSPVKDESMRLTGTDN